jgi:hypothetical protein
MLVMEKMHDPRAWQCQCCDPIAAALIVSLIVLTVRFLAVKRYMLLEEAGETFALAGIDLGLPPNVLAAATASLLSKAWYFPADNTSGGRCSLIHPMRGLVITHCPNQPFVLCRRRYGKGGEQGTIGSVCACIRIAYTNCLQHPKFQTGLV